MRKVLFVCTANICRSPMASAIFRSLVASKGEAGEWEIASSGTWTVEGQPAAEFSQITAQSYGEDLSAHRSREITRQMADESDLILVMEAHHKEALLAEMPHLRGKIYMLSEMAGAAVNIADPYGDELEDYRNTARVIERCLRDGFEKIRSLADSAKKAVDNG